MIAPRGECLQQPPAMEITVDHYGKICRIFLTGLVLVNINTFFNLIIGKEYPPLANHKSAIKRARQNELRRLRNKSVKTGIKTVTKDIRISAGEASAADMTTKINAAQSAIDKASKKGVIHKRTAARKISRLAKLVNSAGS